MTSASGEQPGRIKVLLTIYGLDGGGAERVLITQANHLDRDRFEPVIVLLYAAGPYREQIRRDVRVIELYKENKGGPTQASESEGAPARSGMLFALRRFGRDLMPLGWLERYRAWRRSPGWKRLRDARVGVRAWLGRPLRFVRRLRILNRYLEEYGVWRYVQHSTDELRARFERVIADEAPDAIFSHLLLANYVNLSVEPPPEVFRVVCVHNTPQDYQVRVEHARSPLDRADRIVTVSRAIAEIFALKYGDRKVCTLYNPHDIDGIQTLSRQPLHDPWFTRKDLPVVVGIGRLRRQKNFRLLVEAVAGLNREGRRPVRLVILGEGPERAALLRLVRRRGLENRVRLLGWLPNPFRYLARADLFVLSSEWEGLPNTLIEGLACGVPVVSTDCASGPREILDGGRFGELVPCGDRRALQEAIKRLLTHPKRARELREQGPRRARAFDLSVRISRCEALIVEGVEEGRRAARKRVSPSRCVGACGPGCG